MKTHTLTLLQFQVLYMEDIWGLVEEVNLIIRGTILSAPFREWFMTRNPLPTTLYPATLEPAQSRSFTICDLDRVFRCPGRHGSHADLVETSKC